jgi:hypothetical protein
MHNNRHNQLEALGFDVGPGFSVYDAEQIISLE